MRADAIDLQIADQRLRVVCEEPAGLDVLRGALADHLSPDPAPLAFKVACPRPGHRMFVLLDRSGFVLGRSRSAGEVVSMVLRHLGAWLAPPPGTARMRSRVLVGDRGEIVTAVWPLFHVKPVVERRLERAGFRLVDRLVTDVHADGSIELRPAEWSTELADGTPGHAAAPPGVLEPHRLLVPATTTTEPSRAQKVHLVAQSIIGSHPPDARLDLAEAIADLPTTVAAADASASLYRLLDPDS